jgi:hypothetical protein
MNGVLRIVQFDDLEDENGTDTEGDMETEYFYERTFPRVKSLTKAVQAVLMIEDSGFDNARLLFAKAEERDA